MRLRKKPTARLQSNIVAGRFETSTDFVGAPAPIAGTIGPSRRCERIQELTQGRGADACVDAVGIEASPTASADSMLDAAKAATFLGTDRPHVLRQSIQCCRNFGVVSIVDVYGGYLDAIPMGSAINRGLTFRMAQTPVQRYLPQLLQRIEKGDLIVAAG